MSGFSNISVRQINEYDSLVAEYLSRDVDCKKRQFFFTYIFPYFNFRMLNPIEKKIQSIKIICIYNSVFSSFSEKDRIKYIKINEANIAFFKNFNR